MRVLIAEDDAIPRMILKLAVEQAGHHCLVAEDGSQAWDMYQNVSVDVLISDRIMPGLDGLELCKRVRQSPGSGYTYFIFLTALGDREQIIAGIQAGADDYLPKPLDPEDLRIRLMVAVRVTELHRQLAIQKAELERLNRELFEQGRCDPLTHLGNRLRLMEDLSVISGKAERYNNDYCAIMCDVDNFKLYNDFYGHLAGDEVLRTIAQTLAKMCRNGDAAYRYGGEEFIVLLPEQKPANVKIAAERLCRGVEALQIPHLTKGPGAVVTISAGVAPLLASDFKAMHLWLKRADEAMYRAKQAGRNQVAVIEK